MAGLKSATIVYLTLMIALFGTIFIFTKLLMPPLTVFTYFFIRSGIGTLVLVLILAVKKQWAEFFTFFKHNYKDLLLLALIYYELSLLFSFAGTPYTTPTNQTIINNFNLVLVVLLVWGTSKKRPHSILILAVCLNFLGVLLMIYPFSFSSNATLRGDILMIIGILVGCPMPILNKRLAKDTSPVFIAFNLNALSFIALLPFIFIFDTPIQQATLLTPLQWFAMLWIGIGIAGFAYILNSAAYSDPGMTPEIMGVVLTCTSIIGIIVGVVFFKDTLNPINWIGAVLILVTLYLAQKAPQDEKPAPT